MGMMQEFKEFAMKGNVIDLAVAVVLGGAFGKVVDGFMNGIVNPIINSMGSVDGKGMTVGIFDLGAVISAAINFLMVALVLFFVFVKPMQKMMKKKEESAS